MQNLKVMNARATAVPILGLGTVAAGSARTGTIENVVSDSDLGKYLARAANIGVAVRDLSNATALTQTAYQLVTAAIAVAGATRTAVCQTSGSNYALTLMAANSLPAGTVLYFFFESGANTVTITRAGADTIDGGTTLALATGTPVRRLQTDGVSAWTSV